MTQSPTNKSTVLVGGLFLAAFSSVATAAGVTAYLPLNLEPEIERQIERVLILADEPVLKRPFSIELVRLALPQACAVDKPLCSRVSKYLERYARDYAVTHASAAGSITHGGDGVAMPEISTACRSTARTRAVAWSPSRSPRRLFPGRCRRDCLPGAA